MYRNRDQNRSNGRAAEPANQSADPNDGSGIGVRESRERSESDPRFGVRTADDGSETERNASNPPSPPPFLAPIVRGGRTATSPREILPEATRSSADDGRESTRAHPAELLAPFALSAVYVGLAALVGPELFDTATSGSARIVAYALLGALLHLSAYCTLRLYTETRRAKRRTRGWRPNPWVYVCGGALALVAIRIGEMIVTGRSVSEPVVYLVGNAVVALPLASIVAGPIYWVNRRRRDEPTD